MIFYKNSGISFVAKLCQMRGSVFPFALKLAVPVSTVAFFLKIFDEKLGLAGGGVLNDNSVWSGFTFLVGFLVIFRTSQAYDRFWSGCTATLLMRAEWFDACSALVAFCRHSKGEHSQRVEYFQNVLIRLVSVLHALALAEIEENRSDDPSKISAYRYDMLDVRGLDDSSVHAIKDSDSKIELVYTWIQSVIVDAVTEGYLTIPSPLLTRVWQEFGNGMVFFHDAIKISTIQFPFPYAQLCDGLLGIHMALTPLVVAQWVTSPWASFVFSFVQVFALWCLNGIALEIENPFGNDGNDLEGHIMQQEMNRQLLALLDRRTKQVPKLDERAMRLGHPLSKTVNGGLRCTLWDIWHEQDPARGTIIPPSGFRATMSRISKDGTFLDPTDRSSQTSTRSDPTDRRIRFGIRRSIPDRQACLASAQRASIRKSSSDLGPGPHHTLTYSCHSCPGDVGRFEHQVVVANGNPESLAQRSNVSLLDSNMSPRSTRSTDGAHRTSCESLCTEPNASLGCELASRDTLPRPACNPVEALEHASFSVLIPKTPSWRQSDQAFTEDGGCEQLRPRWSQNGTSPPPADGALRHCRTHGGTHLVWNEQSGSPRSRSPNERSMRTSEARSRPGSRSTSPNHSVAA